jgi:hypothetical protein
MQDLGAAKNRVAGLVAEGKRPDQVLAFECSPSHVVPDRDRVASLAERSARYASLVVAQRTQLGGAEAQLVV